MRNSSGLRYHHEHITGVWSLPLLIALTTALTPVAVVNADQLACLDEARALQAKAIIDTATLLIAYCSLCDDTVTVVVPHHAHIVEDCRYEVHLRGTVVARSTEVVSHDSMQPVPVSYRRCNEPFVGPLDLAYVYVEETENRFRVLGLRLGLEAQVTTEWITLPKGLYATARKKALRMKKTGR